MSDDADPTQDHAVFQQTLRLMMDAGTALLQDLIADPALPAAAKVEPYDRLTRSMRRSIALARHIADNPAKRSLSPAERRTQGRREIIRGVENAIDARCERPEEAESLRDELNERLDDPAFDLELATRPIECIIRDLKRDLGLEPASHGGQTRRTPADIRDINARAAAPTRPPPEPAFSYEPGGTRPNGLLARYHDAADG